MVYTGTYIDENGVGHEISLTEEDSIEALKNDRDALLRRVWGFDYYGGSRTVDVHVRRIRAKLGPELAQHLETVRGVGYLWSA